jgi:hypothetical protein
LPSNQSYPPPGPATPGPTPGPVAPRQPGRRRAGRTLLISAAAGLLAVAVAATGTALASAGAHRGHRAAAALSHRPPPHPRGAKQGSAAIRRQRARAQQGPQQAPPPPRPYGAVISTGIRNSAGELVFYAVRVHTAQLPDTTFGIMGGYRKASGKLTADVVDNEFSGPDTAPGFHAVHAPMTVGKEAIPEFGYYAGPAVKITGIVGGRRILADHAEWSVNPKIVIFWFSPRADRFDYAITGLAAFDAHGKRLPAGHNKPSVG